MVLGAPHDVGSYLFERILCLVERHVEVDVDDGPHGAVRPGREPADHLVGDAMALQDPDDPSEGFPYLLRFVTRMVHHVHPAV